MKFCYDCANIIKEDVEKCPYCGGNLYDAEPKEAYHLKPGITLKSGKYLIGRAIGYGGFGVTYAAFDTVLQRRVAIKEYFPSNFASRSFASRDVSVYTGDRRAQYGAGLSRFLLEARNMAVFGNEPNIVSILDFFEENNTAYIVMEYLEGITLKQYLKQVGGILSLEEAIEIIRPICLALTKVHKSGIVHRDISPDNIFITTANIVKLIDFGAARLSLGDKEETLSVILKPGFAPPEQYRTKSRQGAFTDIYALGATFYRMITGKMPDAAVDRMMEDELAPPSAVIGGIPNEIDTAVMKAMALDYRIRFQNALDFLRALDEGKNGIAVPIDRINAEYYEPRLISETDKTAAAEYGGSNVIENGYAGSAETSILSKSFESPPSEGEKTLEIPINEKKQKKSRGLSLCAKLTAAGLAIWMLFGILVLSGVIKRKPALIPIDAAHFPDANFRNFVLRGSDNKTGVKIDTDGSGALSPAEIAAVTSIEVNSKCIADLTGIGYFTALMRLDCNDNQLTSLNVSKNSALTRLNCWGSQLTSLDISKNTALKELNCGRNRLTGLGVSKNTALEYLACNDNRLTSLDVSKNSALTKLDCSDSWDGDNQLTALDLSKNTALAELYCGSNKLTQLDVSKNTALTYLNCYNNQLTALDVSKNTALTVLYCSCNQLTSLDVSKNTALREFSCNGNQLTNLDLSANTNLTSFSCTDNQYTVLSNPFNLTTLPGKFVVSRASNWQGGNVSGNMLTFTADQSTYTYDCGNGKSATFTLDAPKGAEPLAFTRGRTAANIREAVIIPKTAMELIRRHTSAVIRQTLI